MLTADKHISRFRAPSGRFRTGGAPLHIHCEVRRMLTEFCLSMKRAKGAVAGLLVPDPWATRMKFIAGRAIDCMELEDRTLLSATPLGAETLVNTHTADAQQTATSPQAVAADASGNYVAAWTGFNQNGDGATESNIYAQRFSASGLPQGSEILVNSTTAGSQTNASVAMSANGDFIVTWDDNSGLDGSGWGVFARQFAADGTPQASQFQVNSTFAGDQRYASVATDSVGDFVIAWASYGQDGDGAGVYAQRYHASGVAQGGEF